MKDPIEEIFSQARRSETELPASPFLETLRAEFPAKKSVSRKTNFDWILILAAILASCAVFFLTPLYDWLLALPSILPTMDSLQLLILAAALASISFFVFFDWEFE